MGVPGAWSLALGGAQSELIRGDVVYLEVVEEVHLVVEAPK